MISISDDKRTLYRAHLTRDVRFDGTFFVAVKTTGIYCRPVCPAKKAALKNLTFYAHAAQAEEAGYRPCVRCRPETAPGSPAWLGTTTTVRRAVRLMDTLAPQTLSVKTLADKLGIGEHRLHKLFQSDIGINPQTLLLNKKLDVARNLLDDSTLSITDIALSAGFNSIRRFNDAFKKRFRQTPRSFRTQPAGTGEHTLYLRYRPPLAWNTLMQFFRRRAVTGMEHVTDDTYQRLLVYRGVPGWLRVSLADDYRVKANFRFDETIAVLDFVSRIKAQFDLDADPMAIEKGLRRDVQLRPLLRGHKGLRIPGCWDPFELLARAVIGQQISVKAAVTILTRFVARCGIKPTLDTPGELTHCFPTPEKILTADLNGLGLTGAKIATLKALAQAMYDKTLVLDGTADDDTTCKTLLDIKGIGPWTVNYIALRGLRDPDAFPVGDLALQKRIKQFALDPEKWRPWRAYGAILLFSLPVGASS